MNDIALSSFDDLQTSQAERRLINRLADYWASLLDGRDMPSLKDLKPEHLEDMRPFCFVIDVSKDVDAPTFRFAGSAVQRDGVRVKPGDPISSVGKATLLGRIADHYLEAIANGAPVGIEAEYQTAAGEEVLYRGIVLPLSDDGERVDYVLGAINCKVRETGVFEAAADASPKRAPETKSADAEAEFARSPAPVSSLGEYLARGRLLAQDSERAADRSREALYAALQAAYVFHFESEQATAEYDEILADAGLLRQERAPFTPIVKLIFGAAYDKTRLSEYSSALAYALRRGVAPSSFKTFLEEEPGGVKGCVAAERLARGVAAGSPWNPIDLVKETLRGQPSLGVLKGVDEEGESEFVLILGRRRRDEGGIDVVGLIDESDSVAQSALRRAAKLIKAAKAETAKNAEDAAAEWGDDAAGGEIEIG